MREHCRNADVIAGFLADHPAVTRVIHPSQFAGEDKRRTDTYLTGGNGALVGFELAGGMQAGLAFIDRLKLLHHVANIGDARSLAIHPASTTHHQLTEERQRRSEEHTSELQSLMRIPYAVFCLKKKNRLQPV